MIYYISETSFHYIFSFVSERYAKIEEVPAYEYETGYEKFCSVLKQVHEDVYYPTIIDKAAYLLIGINKGHFFSNGNKRLALVITIFFLGINDLGLKLLSKTEYRQLLEELFPEYMQWEDFGDFTATDFATYNLSIMIADSGTYGISHDQLKGRIVHFLESAVTNI